MKTRIKPITPVDYGEAAEISNRAYRFMQKYYTQEEKKVLGREETSDTIRDSLENRIGVVAENEHGRVVGFMFWRQYEQVVWIGNIAVDPLYQRKSVGGKLLTYVERWSEDRNIDVAMLEVHKRNKKAHDFYTTKGYESLSQEEIKSNFDWPFAKPPVDTRDVFAKRLNQ